MARLIYIHDPMCSWCWGFSAVLQQLLSELPNNIDVVRLLGGLAEDTDEAMSDDMQQRISDTWRHIEATIPGIKFNFDFWQTCQPRRSTYPACRAVIAARQQGDVFDEIMTKAIQQAYYQQARNPSDESVLISLAGEIGLDIQRFSHDFHDPQTHKLLLDEIATTQQLGVDSFPSLVLQKNKKIWHIPIDYNDHRSMLNSINDALVK